MKKQKIGEIIRAFGLVHPVDYLRFKWSKFKHYSKNQKFKKKNPEVNLPPDYLIYESFRMDYEKYFIGGRVTAQWVIDHLSKHLNLDACTILDWGCGPGRIIRHIGDLVEPNNKLVATDYNEKSITWCKENIAGVTFSLNGINPPLTYPDNSINALYAISIFTHLSRDNHDAWMKELYRIASPKQSCFLITTHGDGYQDILTASEKEKFDSGEIVIRDNAKEGHRVFGAFHPPHAFRKIIVKQGFEVMEHIPGTKRSNGFIEQDVWLISKVESGFCQ